MPWSVSGLGTSDSHVQRAPGCSLESSRGGQTGRAGRRGEAGWPRTEEEGDRPEGLWGGREVLAADWPGGPGRQLRGQAGLNPEELQPGAQDSQATGCAPPAPAPASCPQPASRLAPCAGPPCVVGQDLGAGAGQRPGGLRAQAADARVLPWERGQTRDACLLEKDR